MDPRMFVTAPFGPCPHCGASAFGTLMVGKQFHVRRCRNCWHTERRALPPLNKRLVYLDQMLLSNLAKELDPVWRAKTRRPDPFWLEVFDQLDRLMKLQLIVCPESPIHEEESAFDDRFQGVLRRLYTHLASGVSLQFAQQIHARQIWEAVDALDGGRDPDWTRITPELVVDGDLHGWSERLLVTVNAPPWFGGVEDRRATRDSGHAALVQIWKRWKEEKGLTFEKQFERERRGIAEVAVNSCVDHLNLMRRLRTGQQTLSNPLDLVPGALAAMTHQLVERMGREADSTESRISRVYEFLTSEPVLNAPKNHLAALLWAALAQHAVNGRRRPPSRGTANDIDMISAYLPYSAAMFIDDEFAQILRERPLAQEIDQYPTRVFSNRTRQQFLGYLRQIESNADPSHVARVIETYGEGWLTPYRSILEHEREQEARSSQHN